MLSNVFTNSLVFEKDATLNVSALKLLSCNTLYDTIQTLFLRPELNPSCGVSQATGGLVSVCAFVCVCMHSLCLYTKQHLCLSVTVSTLGMNTLLLTT